MSAFEVCITPNRNKIARKAAKSNTESREPTLVTFGPFSGKSTVTFENVPLTKTAKRILIIQNQIDKENKILVTRSFRPEYNIALEWTSYTIPANDEASMEISWTPLKEFSCRETLQLTDSRNFRKDITVILKSIKTTNGSKKQKYHTTGTQNIRPTATLKMKSPTGTRNLNNKRRSLKKIDCYDNNYENRTNTIHHKKLLSPLFDKNQTTTNYERSPQSCVKTLKKGKENISPISPCNASALFDKIQFTPIADKKSNELEYLASLPTPGSRTRSEVDNHGSNENQLCPTIIVISPENEPRTVEKCKLNFEEEKQEEHKEILGTPRYQKPRLGMRIDEEKNRYQKSYIESIFEHTHIPSGKNQIRSAIENRIQNNHIINKTFDLNETKFDSLLDMSAQVHGEQQTIMNRTTVISVNPPRSLSVIEEEEKDSYATVCNTNCMGETFNVSPENVHRVNENVQKDVRLIGVPLRKFSESMKDLSGKNLQTRRSLITNQGSMPNLSDMENLNPITENRYYDQEKLFPQNDCPDLNISNGSVGSISSAVDVVFNQNEILAASSRFNVYDIGTNSVKRSPKFLKPRHKSASPTSPITPPLKPRRISLTPNEQRKTVSTPSLTPTPCKKRIRKSLNDLGSMEVESLDVTQPVCLTISPPKRTKYDYTSSDTISSTNFRNNNSNITTKMNQWSITQPKKHNFSRTNFTLIKSHATPRKENIPEARDVLYNQGILFHACINPDPFAATTTCDPFITETMYLDDRAVAKHEMQIKKWLNALVSIPAEFDSDCNQKIDVGHLFNEVRNKALTLAPTKEEQSVNYLTTGRMEALRAAAIKLFQSPEITEPCCKVAVQISKQSLRIRKDRDLHLDVVLQREMLELLLSFNPLWLRIGLEVVFSERITLQSNTDVVGLSSFIVHRLFRDKYLEQKYSRAFTLSEEYSELIKKFTLQKFLFLLLFLDKAKEKRIIKHNPCLFVKSSQYKETKDILLRFSSELIASIGDITRMLRRYGYCLTHKQTYLDEFNYAFNNLAVDLRDGVRLTRVMEIILLRDDLTKQLRVPAISRLQRVYNVNLALKALSDAEFQLTGNIAASDIVDGHREKTLSLLWQIIYKFRAPKFNAAATTIQKWWRKSWLKVMIRRRIRYKEEMKRNKAATKIQSLYRGYITRKYVTEFRRERENAAIIIQKYIRRYLVQKRFKYVYKCILIIQEWYRKSKLGIKMRQKYLQFRNSVIKIQIWYRRVLLARKLESLIPFIRNLQERRRIECKSAFIIQKSIKSFIIRKKLHSIVNRTIELNRQTKLENRCASKIQSYFRMILVRKQYTLMKQSAIKIQNYWKAYMTMKSIRSDFIVKKKAAVTIQSRFRDYLIMKKQRAEFLKIRSSAIILQRRFRAMKLCVSERRKYQSLRISAIKIQLYYRSVLETRRIRAEFLHIKSIIIRVQRKFRANKEMHRQLSIFKRTKSAAITLQRYYRGRLLTKQTRKEFLLLRSSVIKIQEKYRATLLGRRVRKEFVKLRCAALCVQQRFRANCMMRNQRRKYLEYKRCVISIQRRFRANLLMKIERQNYLSLKQSSLTIQRRFRAYKEMRITRARYEGKRQATIYLQRRFRDYLLMKKERNDFLAKRNAIVILQRRYRARRQMLKIRGQYLKMRHSAIILQNRFRANKAMKIQKEKYLKLYEAILKIQKWYRATKYRDIQRAEYLRIRKAAIIIQTRFRAQIAMKISRMEYQNLKKSIVVIQRRFRANRCMKIQRAEYNRIRNATIKIQNKFRATLLRNNIRFEFLKLRASVITVQQRFRALLEMKKVKSEYENYRQKVIHVQRRYRAKRFMKEQRKEYLKLKSAAIVIQRRFRAKLMAEEALSNYQNLKKLVIGLQAHARGFLARKRLEEMMTPEIRELIKQRKAAIVIQRYWRGHLVRKRLQNYKIVIIRSKIQNLKKDSKPQNTVYNRVHSSIKFLRGRFNVQETLGALTRLENISRVLPNLLMEHSEHISNYCYGIMAQAIRSEIDKQLIELCSRIILNMARYDCTTVNTFQEHGLVTIAQMLLRWCDKECGIFNTLCTLIWIFGHYPDKRRKIRAFMTTHDALYMLRETKKLLLRKEKMKKNVRKPSSLTLTPHREIIALSSQSLPNFEPDFGVIRNKPYIFIDSVFGFECVLDILGIDLK